MAGSPVKHERNRIVRAAILRGMDEGGDPVDYIQPYIEKLKEMAVAGDIAALKEIFDRLDGKPQQQVEVGGSGIAPVLNIVMLEAAREVGGVIEGEVKLKELTMKQGEGQLKSEDAAPDFARETGFPKGVKQLDQEQAPNTLDPAKGGGRQKGDGAKE